MTLQAWCPGSQLIIIFKNQQQRPYQRIVMVRAINIFSKSNSYHRPFLRSPRASFQDCFVQIFTARDNQPTLTILPPPAPRQECDFISRILAGFVFVSPDSAVILPGLELLLISRPRFCPSLPPSLPPCHPYICTKRKCARKGFN